MASKSATAYQEAIEQGLPIGSGHGGHDAGENTDHSDMTMPPGSAEPEHGTGGGANEHSEHSPEKAGADSDPMAGMDHSKPAAGSAPMAGMDHSKPGQPGGAVPMAGMDHAAMGHGTPIAIAPPYRAPTSSSEIGRLDPAKTLEPDEFDQVAPLSTSEAEKGDQGTGHEGHGAPAGPEKP